MVHHRQQALPEATRTYTAGATHYGIQISNTTGNSFNISDNRIGHNSVAGTGAYTMAVSSTTLALNYVAIALSVGASAATTVQNNPLIGFTMTTGSTSSLGQGAWCGISVTAGVVNIGTVTGNVIGNSGADSISVTNSYASSPSVALVVGINNSSAAPVVISNNSIGFIIHNGSATTSVGFRGIQNICLNTIVISGNTIGHSSAAASISLPTPARPAMDRGWWASTIRRPRRRRFRTTPSQI
ncbi:MAG: hypothetical protein IPP94_17525 [Ignavibacteria bacterium]|nr:hypothetical protein [Ignavibacteria bacterium]